MSFIGEHIVLLGCVRNVIVLSMAVCYISVTYVYIYTVHAKFTTKWNRVTVNVLCPKLSIVLYAAVVQYLFAKYFH